MNTLKPELPPATANTTEELEWTDKLMLVLMLTCFVMFLLYTLGDLAVGLLR